MENESNAGYGDKLEEQTKGGIHRSLDATRQIMGGVHYQFRLSSCQCVLTLFYGSTARTVQVALQVQQLYNYLHMSVAPSYFLRMSQVTNVPGSKHSISSQESLNCLSSWQCQTAISQHIAHHSRETREYIVETNSTVEAPDNSVLLSGSHISRVVQNTAHVASKGFAVTTSHATCVRRTNSDTLAVAVNRETPF